MKSVTPYIYIIAACLASSCSQEEMVPAAESTGTLVLQVSTGSLPQVSTRAVDADLTVELRYADGSLYKKYLPGQTPDKILLVAGEAYTVRAYTDNQSDWQTANSGKGAACFFGETTVQVAEDETVYCTYQVPMTNYAVTLTLPDLFDQLFKSYSFLLTSSGRTDVVIREGEKAYFEAGTGFTYKLTATNNDNKTSSHSAISFPDTEAGKLYNIKYIYGSDLNQGGIDIEITDNEEHEDVDINL